VVPGGPGEPAAAEDPVIQTWLQSASATARWTTSVCTGALILGSAGLLDGKRATTHWLALEQLAGFGAEPVAERVVVDGALVTAAGVSAGIDMGLVLAARIAGDRMAQTIQLGIEYDPQPPFRAGSPHVAPEALVGMLRRHRAAVLRR
jgi:transcriptional regulator GlxA family with amidase domain